MESIEMAGERPVETAESCRRRCKRVSAFHSSIHTHKRKHRSSQLTAATRELGLPRASSSISDSSRLVSSSVWVQPPYGLTEQEHQSWLNIKLMPIRMRVVNILKSWFGSYWMEGYDTPSRELIRRAYDFASKSIASSNTPGAQPVMAVLDQRMRGQEPITRELIRNTNMSMPPPILPKSLKKFKFLDIDATEFARQLTIMEANLYEKVKAAECLYKMWPVKLGADDPDPTPNIKALILHSNCLTNWVAEMILTQSEVKKRTLVIKRFITIADVSARFQDIALLPQLTHLHPEMPCHEQLLHRDVHHLGTRFFTDRPLKAQLGADPAQVRGHTRVLASPDGA